MANKYMLEVLANDGGFRGLIIDTKTKLVERRTRIQKTKTDAFNALSELVEAFLTSYPKADILGVSMINKETVISAGMVLGLFEG
ncbi:hypothetical protein AANUM_1133 [Aggregatibacter actinomycetemcomitans NUM4039]|uniref:hypothetical protein n=1 Tax=Aggregatibacter actinomycetemcomitans TaxID=714 RepID=UPI0006BC81CD|nr:hypothetical protein [Aggregatibacter actinomycetemcomitans]BAS48364.1 hypothetical protein AANUM_1133 [Aggregatibacter actinomycetemcomitans NUM4039]